MSLLKRYDNGLRLIVKYIPGLFSVSCGIIVGTGSVNETAENNGISHFIEHTMFKGTKNRSAFEISDSIDSMGGVINAYTSKETTCYYTKSTAEHLEESLDILSDIFFNSTFLKEELEREKGVIIEEISMSEDSPEDVCYDLLSKSFYGDTGYGQTILGPIKNIKKFSKQDILDYMDRYYTADNVVISVAGNINEQEVVKLVDGYFAEKFTRFKSSPQYKFDKNSKLFLNKYKKIEQSHIGICFPTIKITDKNQYPLNIATTILGGGMSSRLFQKIREELGLCYNIYSSLSLYKDNGVMEIYSGVSPESSKIAVDAIINVVNEMKENGITEQEFLRGKEQVKSSFVMGQESTVSQMFCYGRYLLYFDVNFDFNERMKEIESISINDVNRVIKQYFNISNASTCVVGPKKVKIIL